MFKDNAIQTLKRFDKGEHLSLAQLKFLNRHLMGKCYSAVDPEEKKRWEDKVEEVQVDIDFWVELEKTNPFASQEKYTR